MFDLNEGYSLSEPKFLFNILHKVFTRHSAVRQNLSPVPLVLAARRVGSQTEAILKVFDCVGEQRLHSGAFSECRLIRRALPHCYLWLYLSCSLCSD